MPTTPSYHGLSRVSNNDDDGEGCEHQRSSVVDPDSWPVYKLVHVQASDDDDFQAPPSEGDSSDSGELESMSDDGKEEGWEAVSGEAEDEDVGEEEEESSSEFETEEGEDEGSDDGSEDEEGSEDEGASEEDEEPAAHARARSRGKASTSAPGSEDGEEKLGGKRKRQAAQV